MFKKLTLFLSIFLLFQTLHAQLIDTRIRIDSLKNEFKNLSPLVSKEQKGNLYFQIALTYLNIDVDSARTFANEGIQYAQSINYKMLEGRMLLAKAGIFKSMGEYNLSLSTYDDAINIALKVKDSIAAASAINDKAICLQFLRRYHEAIKNYTKAIKIFTQLDNEAMTGMSYGSLSLLHYKLSQYSEAIKSANRSIRILQKWNYPNFMNQPLNVLGNIAKDKRNFSTAENYYSHILDIAQKSHDNSTISHMQLKLGRIAQLTKKDKLAQEYYNKSINSSLEAGNIKIRINALIYLATTYLDSDNYNYAEDLLRRAENFALKDGEEEYLTDLYHQYGKLYIEKDQHGLSKKYFLEALEQGLKIPYFDCSEIYESIKKELGESVFENAYPTANQYLDSIKLIKEKLELIPFAYDVVDLKQTVKSQRDEAVILKNDNGLKYVLILIATLLIVFLYVHQKRSQKTNQLTDNSTVPLALNQLYVLKEIQKISKLSSTYQKFDKEINKKLLIDRGLYLDVNASTAKALSSLTKERYSVNQIRIGFKAILTESFNDYKFRLRVVDFIENLLQNILKGTNKQVNSNSYGLDSDRQLSVVVNSICGIKLSSYKKLIDSTSRVMLLDQDCLVEMLKDYSGLEIHASIVRMNMLKHLNYQAISFDVIEQNKVINQYIQTYALTNDSVIYLQNLNSRHANFDHTGELFLSALYFWLSKKSKYPIEFIQQLTRIFWGFDIDKESIVSFGKQI